MSLSKPSRRIKFKVLIDESLCKGCALCVYICNKLGGKVLKESSKRTLLGGTLPALDGECIGCRMCERYCPEFSIIVEE